MAKKRVLVLFGPNILREVEKDTVGATELSLILEHLPTTVMPFGTPFNVCVFLLLKRIWKIYLLWKISVTNLLLPLYVRDKSVVWEQKAICWHWKLWQE